jgi:hypothetical protein
MGSLFDSGLSPSESSGDLVRRGTFCHQLHETLIVIERPTFSLRHRPGGDRRTGKPFLGLQDSYASADGLDASAKFRRDRKTRLASGPEFEKPLVRFGRPLLVAVRGHSEAISSKKPAAVRIASGQGIHH